MRYSPFFCLLLAAAIPATAHAQSAYTAPGVMDRAAASYQQDYVVPYVGYFDITQSDGNEAAQFGLEYRFAPYYWNLRPTVGINVTTDSSVYGYGGVFWDIDLWQSGFYLTPNFVAGLYSRGDGKRLGGTVEFRSGLELGYELENLHRVGISFNHISNASIYDKNPGAETLLINYHIPVGKWF